MSEIGIVRQDIDDLIAASQAAFSPWTVWLLIAVCVSLLPAAVSLLLCVVAAVWVLIAVCVSLLPTAVSLLLT